MKKKGYIFSLVVLCLLIIAATAFYLYQKPRTSLTNIKPAFTLSARELYEAFKQDEQKANKQFLEKIILVSGTVDNVQVTDSTVSLLLTGDEMGGVNCSVKKSRHDELQIPSKGATVKVKGRCVGFLMDVNLVDAIIEK
jgi:tRNA(Leu) C34 or U34 (ribose-2'-O)-methylase TrmL